MSKIEVTYSVEGQRENGSVRFNIQTNLPFGTRVLCWLSSGKRTWVSNDSSVLSGEAIPLILVDNDEVLASGDYDLLITQLSTKYQPNAAAREAIGPAGENLSGPNVYFYATQGDYRPFAWFSVHIRDENVTVEPEPWYQYTAPDIRVFRIIEADEPTISACTAEDLRQR